MQWDFNRAVFLQHDVIREHAVDSTAERTFVNIGSRLAAAPALKEISSNAIADFYPRHAGADFDHFTGAVGKRDQIFTHRHAITATRNSEVAKIERAVQASGTLRVNAIIFRNTSILTSNACRGTAGMAAANPNYLVNSPPFSARISTELVASS